MNKKILRTAILLTTLLLAVTNFGQNVLNSNGFIQNQMQMKIVDGSVYANFADRQVVAGDIVSDLNKLLKLDENHSFVQISQREDELGFIHTNFQEYYKGYPVDGNIIMLHQKDGYLKSITGNVAALKNVVVRLEIPDIEATNIAKANLGVTKVFRESPVLTVFVQNLKDKQYYLAKKVRIESFAPLARYDVFVDANTGEVLKKLSLIYDTDVLGSAQTFFYDTQEITCDSLSPGSFRLYDNARKIGTYNGATWDPFADDYIPSADMLYTNTSSVWNTSPTLDVHWGMEKTHDFYQNTFARNSYDDNGGEIYNIYNPVALDSYGYYLNAAWMGEGIMIYGRGSTAYGYYPFVSLDCAAHELTHGVTEYNGNGGLYYEGESGALNESFSDIFGTCVEFSALPNPNWTIGEDIVMYGALRDMSNPKVYQQPDTYHGYYWANTNSSYDNGGVHTNSGVQNFWFYLLCEGGTGVNDLGNTYSVTPIGMIEAQQIVYRNLMHYITPYSGYINSYNGSLLAAADLYGNSSDEYTAVQQAWYAVGIDDNMSQLGCGYGSVTYLTEPSGTFNDGSGNGDYLENQSCTWIIEPSGASYVTLSFTAFDTETNYDYVKVYDSYDNYNNGTYLARLSGHSIPSPITSNTGMMIVTFITDEYVNYSGWTANYISNGTSVDNIEQNSISIFPNPANNVLNIQFNNNIQNGTINIYNMLGKLIKQYPLQNIQAASRQTFDIESIPAGIYNVRIFTDNEQINHKLIISK